VTYYVTSSITVLKAATWVKLALYYTIVIENPKEKNKD